MSLLQGVQLSPRVSVHSYVIELIDVVLEFDNIKNFYVYIGIIYMNGML